MSSKTETKSTPPVQKRSGARDVRQELIDAALQILSEEGLEKLTLRRVAARVGVSHAAPAHHFKGLPQLLGSICAIGFDRLTETMLARRNAAPETPRDRLVAICDGYVDFAIGNPGLAHLMFNSGKETVDDTLVHEAGAKAYGVLSAACAPFQPVGARPDSTESLIWSLVHGLSFLCMGGRFDNPNRMTPHPSVADLIPQLALK